MTVNTIELACGAIIETIKVCGRSYMKAVQKCTGKNILVMHSEPLKHIREQKKYLRRRLEMHDWNHEFTDAELAPLYKWMLATCDGMRAISNGVEPKN